MIKFSLYFSFLFYTQKKNNRKKNKTFFQNLSDNQNNVAK